MSEESPPCIIMSALDMLDMEDFRTLQPGQHLAAEVEEGNHEYKVRLTALTDAQLNHRITQLLWRLQEGNNEAIYHIGVEDNGNQLGLNEADLKESLQNLQFMAQQTDCEMIIRALYTGAMGITAEVVMRRKLRNCIDSCHLTVAVAGDVDCGKSTLIGVLSTGHLDNGKGLARMQVMTHNHEVQSGRTSSISHTVIHFDQDGAILNSLSNNSDKLRTLSDLELVDESVRSVSLVDLAGHVRYLKTTLHGLSALRPDYCLVCISALHGVTSMTAEHIGIGLYLSVPLVVVVTKVDCCRGPVGQTKLQQVLASVQRLFPEPKRSVVIHCQQDLVSLLGTSEEVAQPAVPIFALSSVTGQGLDLLTSFLHQLPAPCPHQDGREGNVIRLLGSFGGAPEDEEEGRVMIGKVVQGNLTVGADLLLGPTAKGAFLPVSVASIRLNNVPVRCATTGQTATFRISREEASVAACASERKRGTAGMVLVNPTAIAPRACWEFTASIVVLNHPSKIRVNYEPVVHIGGVKQVAKIVSIRKGKSETGAAVEEVCCDEIGNGERAECRFRFLYFPEYFVEGDAVIIREDRTKAVGNILRLL